MLPNSFRAQRSPVAHHTGGVVVAGSNPAVPTNQFEVYTVDTVYSFAARVGRPPTPINRQGY